MGRRAPINLCPNRFDGSCRRDRRRAGGRRLVVFGTAGPGGFGQRDRTAGPYGGSAGRDRSARLPAGARPDTPADRRIRRRSRHQRPHPGGRRAGHPVVGAIADRVVHGAAGEDVRRLDRILGGGPCHRTVVAQDVRRYRQAAQRSSRPHRGARRRRRGRRRPRLARGGGRCSPGKPATCCCWDRAQPDRRLRYSSARPPRRSCATPRSP